MLRVHLSAPLFVVFLSLSGIPEARTITVGAGGEFDTLSAAVTASVTGDVISVAEGVYDGTRGESFPIHLDHPIRIHGIDENNKSIIRGNLDGSLLIADQVDGLTLENLCIREGGGDSGPAVECSESLISVTSCVFEGNNARFGTNAFCAHGSTVRLHECVIGNNRTTEGSLYSRDAIRLEGSHAIIVNCTVVSNLSVGVFCIGGSIDLFNTRIQSNAPLGAEVVLCRASFRDCVFEDNSEGGLSIAIMEDEAVVDKCAFIGNGGYGPFGLYTASYVIAHRSWLC